MDQLRALLERYTQPCAEDCEHSQCPLLRELHAMVISDTLERARLKVKPTVDRERAGEFVGDLMNMRLHASPVSPSLKVEDDEPRSECCNAPVTFAHDGPICGECKKWTTTK